MKKDKKVIFLIVTLIVTLIVLFIIFTIDLVSFGILKANNGKHIYEIEIDKDDEVNKDNDNKDDDNISNKYYRDENGVFIFDSIPEYDEINKIFRHTNYITGIAKYKDNDLEIEISSSKVTDGYVKVNNNIINQIDPYGEYSEFILYYDLFRIFKLNDYYIVEFNNSSHQCGNEYAIVINKEGKFIGKTNAGDSVVNSYSKEKNQIYSGSYLCGTTVIVDISETYDDKLEMFKIKAPRDITYQITENELKIVNSAVKKDDVYYIYDDKGNYKTFSSEGTVKKVELNDKIYYFDINGSTVKVYDNNLKYLWNITGLASYDNYSINSDNTITFDAEIDGIFVVFDDNMNLIYESKKYEMFDVINDYVIVIQDNKVKILDLKENEITSFDELPDEYEDIRAGYLSSEEIAFSISNWRYTYNLETKEKNIRK